MDDWMQAIYQAAVRWMRRIKLIEQWLENWRKIRIDALAVKYRRYRDRRICLKEKTVRRKEGASDIKRTEQADRRLTTCPAPVHLRQKMQRSGHPGRDQR